MSLFTLIYNTPCKTVGKDVDYAILKQKDKIILLFQGSVSDQDWLIDFNFSVRLYKKYLIHRGFSKAWQSANQIIMKELESVHDEYPDLPIFITGHSMGGVYATLACEDFYFRTGVKSTVITYGMPKFILTGKKKFLESGMFVNYVVKNDVIRFCVPLYRRLSVTWLGEFNLKSMLTNIEANHLSYGDFPIA